MADLNTLITQ